MTAAPKSQPGTHCHKESPALVRQRTSSGTASRASRQRGGAPGAAARPRAPRPATRPAAEAACGPGSAPASRVWLSPALPAAAVLRQLPGSLVAIQFVATYFVGTCLLNRASMPGEASPGAKKASCCGARLQQAHYLSALCHEHAVDLQRRQQPRWHLPRQSRPHRTSELQAMRPPEQRMG